MGSILTALSHIGDATKAIARAGLAESKQARQTLITDAIARLALAVGALGEAYEEVE